MRTSRQIGSSHLEEMELILDFVEGFDVDRLLYAINGKHFDEDEITSLTLDIREQNGKLSRQKLHLFSFGKTFNKEWTTDDNECFDSSLKVSRKISSGTKGVRDVIMRFCRVRRKKSLPNHEPQQAINVSMISTPHYMADLFGMESYPDCVIELFRAMLEFYGTLDECIHEAIRVLDEEKAVDSNDRKKLELFIEACDKSIKGQPHIIEAVMGNESLKNEILNDSSLSSDAQNPVLKEWRKTNDANVSSRYFHRCSTKEVHKIALQKALQEADGEPELASCMTLFGCDKAKAKQINEAIARFDSFLPAKCKRGKIPAVHLFIFMKWCSLSIGYNSFLNYFNKRYKGKWETISRSAMSNVTQSSQFDTVKKEMHKKLAEMFPKSSFQQSA